MNPSQSVPVETKFLGTFQVLGKKVGEVHVMRFPFLRIYCALRVLKALGRLALASASS
jgi:hypothetical protein